MEERVTHHEFDVIVIGAGGAGLRAAIEASRAGVSVGMICKSMLGKAHTVMAEGEQQQLWQTKIHEIHGRLTSETP